MPSSTASTAAPTTSSFPISTPPATARRARSSSCASSTTRKGGAASRIAVRSDLAIEDQVTASGATWLDRQSSRARSGGARPGRLRRRGPRGDGSPGRPAHRAGPRRAPGPRHRVRRRPDRHASTAGRWKRWASGSPPKPASRSIGAATRRVCRRDLPAALRARLRPLRHDRRRPRLPARALDALPRKAARPPRLRRRPRRRRHRLGLRPQPGARPVSDPSHQRFHERTAAMSATKILWGQVITVFAIVLAGDLDARRSGPPGGSASSPSSDSPGSSCCISRSTFRRPSSGGGTPTTPTRPTSSSRAPTSPHRAGSSPRPSRSACRSGAPAKRRMPRPTAPPAGRNRRRSKPPDCSDPMASCSAATSAAISATMGRSMCCASRRPDRGKGVGLVIPSLLDLAGLGDRPRHQGRELAAHRRLPRPARPRAAVRSDQREVVGLQSAARGAPRRMGGARRPEHRRHPGRSRRQPRKAEPLGEDQPRAAGRRHPARPLCRGGQDARRRRRLPLRSQAADRVDARRP